MPFMKLNGVLVKLPGGGLLKIAPPVVTLTSENSPVDEGSASFATFVVNLSRTSDKDISIQYQTVDGTAVAGVDYVSTTGTLVIPAGETTDVINVPLNDVTDYEGVRDFQLELTDIQMGTRELTSGQTATIVLMGVSAGEPPPTNYPVADNSWPRGVFVANAYASQVPGTKTFDSFRTRMLASHVSRINSTITYVVHPDIWGVVQSRDVDKMGHEMYTMALLAIIASAPSTTGVNWQGKTLQNFLDGAKVRLMEMSERDHRVLREDSTVDDNPQTYQCAETFGILYALQPSLFSDADLQYLAEGAIRAYARRTIVGGIGGQLWTEGAQKGLCRGTLMGVALKGVPITGSSTYTSTTYPYPQIGETYMQAMERLANQAKADYMALGNRGESDFGGRAGFPDGFLYAHQSYRANAVMFAYLSGAFGENFFTKWEWYKKWPYYYLQSIHRANYSATDVPRSNVLHKQSSMFEMSAMSTAVAVHEHFLRDADPVITSVIRHRRQTISSGVDADSSNRYTHAYPLWHYIFGYVGEPAGAAAETFNDTQFPRMNEYATGEFCFRSTNGYDLDATIVWFWAIDKWLGGHQQALFGAMEMHRGGQLMVHGGTHKTNSSGPNYVIGKSKSGGPDTDASMMSIYRTGEGVNSNGNRVAGGLNTSSNSYIKSLKSDSHGYVRYTQTAQWNTSPQKASMHRCTFVYLQGQNGGQPYVVRLDKITIPAVDRFPILALKVPYKPEILDGAVEVLIDGSGTGASGWPSYEARPGTVSVATGSTTVTGVGTSFKDKYGAVPGANMRINGVVKSIETVNSNTSITLKVAWSPASVVDGTWEAQTSIYNNPDTEGQSGEYQSDTAKWRMVNNKGGGNGVLYCTSLYPADPDVRRVGGDKNWATRDFTDASLGGRLDTNRDTEARGGVLGVHVPSNEDLEGPWTYLTDEAARWFGRWRMEQRDGSGALQQKFLSVFHPGNATTHTTTSDVVLTTSTNDAVEGVVIKDAARWQVVVGPKGHTDPVISAAFTYPVTSLSGTAHHVITGLQPNTPHNITRSGTNFTVTPGSGSYTSDAAGVIEVTL